MLAGTYLNRGHAYIDLAQAVRSAAGLRRCASRCAPSTASDWLADKARHNLGYVAYMTGDLPTALRHYAEVERSYQVSTPGLLPALRLDQARALLSAGLATDAARHLDEVIPRLRAQRAGQDLAEAEVTRAAAALLDGRVTEARRLARSAERRFTRRGNTRWAAVAALAALRAETASALPAPRIPRRLPERAVKLADTLRALLLEDETGLALMLAVRMELRRGDPAAAEVLLDQLPQQRATTPLDHRMLLRLCRAELAVARGDRRRALAEARGGLAELGRARDRMGGLELVCGTAIHGQQLGDLAVRLVLDGPRRDARQLFGWLERTRAQVYRYEPLPAIDDPVLAEQVSSLRSLRRAAQQARLAGRSPRREEKQIVALEREVVRQGWYASPWGRPRPVASLADGRGGAGRAGAGDVRGVRRRAGGGGRRGWPDPARPAALGGGDVRVGEAAARRPGHATRRTGCRRRSARWSASRPGAARTWSTRGWSLPLLPFVGDRELVIVPTGALYAVPWGSLPSLRGRPVVVAPSATAWLTAAVDRPVGRPRGAGQRPTPARDDRGGDGADAAIYPAATRLPAATVGAVLAALDGAAVAHLAAHGEHEPTNAMFSRLELADGPLFAHELARLANPPRQVVLAACELAMNHIRPGDEALGFAGGAAGERRAHGGGGEQPGRRRVGRRHDGRLPRRVAAGDRPAVALAAAVAADPLRRPFICLGAG